MAKARMMDAARSDRRNERTTAQKIDQLFDSIRNAVHTGEVINSLLKLKGNRRKFAGDEEAAITLAEKYLHAQNAMQEFADVAIEAIRRTWHSNESNTTRVIHARG